MSYAFSGALAGALGQAQPAPPAPFFEDRTAAGVTYRAIADPNNANRLAGNLVGWKVREGADPNEIHADVTERARLTPYTEATGPRDPGDGYRWIAQRVGDLRDEGRLGRGIIMVPPAGFAPDTDISRATTGEIRLIATEDAAELAEHARTGQPGFVMYDPRQGWEGAAPPSTKGAWPRWVKPAAVAVGLTAVGLLALRWAK